VARPRRYWGATALAGIALLLLVSPAVARAEARRDPAPATRAQDLNPLVAGPAGLLPAGTAGTAPVSASAAASTVGAGPGAGPKAAGPVVAGSAAFVQGISAALELMKARSPDDYALVAAYVTAIKEGPSNYSWGGSRIIQIEGRSAVYSPPWAGGSILHEAVHVRNWLTASYPVYGCDGEARSLRAQASYLSKVGDAAGAQYVEQHIGRWC
jgi:hypothetical protein